MGDKGYTEAFVESDGDHHGLGLGKNQQRRLSSGVNGLLAEALRNVSVRRSALVVLVNAAYTSQACSSCGALGNRKGICFTALTSSAGS